MHLRTGSSTSAARRTTAEAGVSEATDNTVRLVTMHSSKGLEFPIVVLANLGTKGGSKTEPVADRAAHRLDVRITAQKKQFQTPGFEAAWTAEKAQLDAEELRLLYVAATRARDRLIIPVSAVGNLPAKLKALDPFLPAADAPLETPAGGCVLLDPARLPTPLDDEPPAPATPPPADVSRALEERATWIAERAATRATGA